MTMIEAMKRTWAKKTKKQLVTLLAEMHTSTEVLRGNVRGLEACVYKLERELKEKDRECGALTEQLQRERAIVNRLVNYH